MGRKKIYPHNRGLNKPTAEKIVEDGNVGTVTTQGSISDNAKRILRRNDVSYHERLNERSKESEKEKE